jgi:hypothetical protein
MAMKIDFEKAKGVLIAASAYGPNGFEFGKKNATNLIESSGLLYFFKFLGSEKNSCRSRGSGKVTSEFTSLALMIKLESDYIYRD